jgi:hypothetical protein
MHLSLSITHGLILIFYTANGFLHSIQYPNVSKTHNTFRHHVHGQHKSSSPSKDDGKKKPMIVVGDANAALGAGLALCVMDVLRQTEGFDSKPLPPAQLLAFFNLNPGQSNSNDMDHYLQTGLLFGQHQSSDTILRYPTGDDYQDMFVNMDQFLSMIYADATQYDKPILYISLKEDTTTISNNVIQSLVNPKIRDNISFLGIGLKNNLNEFESGNLILSKEEAISLGNNLNEVLHCSSTRHSSLKATIVSDLPTHLAMLQANSLPKSNHVLDDCWVVHTDMKDGSTILFEYQFDYSNPMGGTDPLLCSAYGYTIALPGDDIKSLDKESLSKSKDAFAAAYSAMLGSGMDPLSSLCVATSVKAVFMEMEHKDLDFPTCSPSYNWETVMKVAEYSRKSRQIIQREDGLSRKLYREFGYK